MEKYLLISDAAKEVQVESHVLRYWEEELHLPIKRNELGHRYYTQEDVERFKSIKSMKERGLQLKAIKMILKNGKLDVLTQQEKERRESESGGEADPEAENAGGGEVLIQENTQCESREDKARRLQWIMQQMIREAVRENNAEMVRQIKECVLKELDYQFRMQEERQEERARADAERTENYYRQMDELLRKKSGRNLRAILGKRPEEKAAEPQKGKKKKHFVV